MLVNDEAAFWATEKTDEKKPLCWPEVPFGVFPSSSGVNAVTVDNLLGAWAADADRTRRCEIIFPVGLTVMPGEDMEFRDLIDSGESMTGSERI